MIIFPRRWNIDYFSFTLLESLFIEEGVIQKFIDILRNILEELKIKNLAYSGGIDSTIILALLTELFGKGHITTYVIASRKNHPDVLYSKIGSNYYGSNHVKFIGEQIYNSIYKQFFNILSIDEIICCDGIDEFMCGYYSHQKDHRKTYELSIRDLVINHLISLNLNSGVAKVFLPYLDEKLIRLMAKIPLKCKVDTKIRKKVVVEIARKLNIPQEIIERNKYGFCDAFLMKDKGRK